MTVRNDQSFNLAEFKRLQRRIVQLEDRLNQQQVKIQTLTKQLNVTTPSVSNLLINSDFAFSIDAYTNSGASTDPNNHSAYNWYLHAAPSGGQVLGTSNADTLKAAASSLYNAGTDDPDWQLAADGNGEAGYARIGNTKTLDTILAKNIVFPSQTAYVGFSIYNTRSDNIPASLQFFAGLWDPVANDWVKGSAFAAPTLTRVGTAGANSYTYQIFAQTDWGDKYNSNTATINNCQAPGSLSTSNYVTMDWTSGKLVGATVYDVYRQDVTGGTFAWVGRITNGSTVFLDQGASLQTVGGFPAGGGVPKAYAAIINFNPPASTWKVYSIGVPIPATYNFSSLGQNTLWLRMGLSAALTGAQPSRSLYIDKVFLALNDGLWAANPADLSTPKKQPDIGMTGSAQGSTGITGSGRGAIYTDVGRGGERGYLLQT